MKKTSYLGIGKGKKSINGKKFQLFINRAFILSVVLLFSYLIYKIPDLIKVNSVECNSQFGVCSRQIEEELTLDERTGLRKAKSQVSDKLEENILISEYRIQYKIPGKLEVFLIEKKPLWALRNLENGMFAQISEEGKVLFVSEDSNLPTLYTERESYNVGDMVGKDELFALKLAGDIYHLQEISRMELKKDHLIVELNSVPRIIFPLEGDRQLLIGKMNLILTQVGKIGEDKNYESREIREVDLRFQNPVLR